uniref:F-box domain-containing protein n=1 Tax=Helicotheca tamesis TaxID=374047 RepID=A0A7S2IIX5_9STRA|mmetsp:Transcript_9922/g.13878  ORF Transcript_9922/g.13878 Transcript_9922/m.13878 type:complete len:596 (+) Transcript_9922:73-1860(+)|eukprot:CAMPEP_0185731700 /NCGR_PEP_ID=MMETSP1171-20130828/13768_1 /TAXON_ID=374046 /ORGANISM="Helicotheca tamensis, Strain CCMP826" /LENGTH=595 /DNA_ID=CAMNT_0028401015 /DNA_START=68 /DNA_END=1855 /DNA_ORIENTATION=+
MIETETIFSPDGWPETIVVEVSLFLTVSEVQYGMARVCQKWRNVFLQDDFAAWRRTCFEEFGCDPVLPKGRVWSEWITQLRGLVRFGLEERVKVFAENRLHSGNVVLPCDFHFRFASRYVKSQARLQNQINVRRAELTSELVCLASSITSDPKHSQLREMADVVMSLRALALEQRDLERTYRRYKREQRWRKLRDEEEAYRKSRTSKARDTLRRICNDLTVAVAEGPPASVAARIAETADNDMLQLLPDSDMLGNDKARCQELRKICRSLLKELQRQALGSCSVDESSCSSVDSEATSSTPLWPEWVVVEVSLYLTLLEAQRGMARVCSDWRRIFLHDLPAWRRICFNEFGCDPILPSGLTWSEWITHLRYLVGLGMAEEQYYRYWERGLHSGNVVLPCDFHYHFTTHYIDAQARLIKEMNVRRLQLTSELATMASCVSSDEWKKDCSQRRSMIDKVISLRALASEQRELEVTYRRHKQEERTRRIEEEEKSYRISRTSDARRTLTRIQNELTAALEEAEEQRSAYFNARLAAIADNDMLGLLPDCDMLGYDKARCHELRLICRALVKELQIKATDLVEHHHDTGNRSPPRKRRP